MDLTTVDYRNVGQVSGPLVILDGGKRFCYGAILEVVMPDGTVRRGQVLDVSTDRAVVQVLEGTDGLDTAATSIRLTDEVSRLAVSREMIGRVFSGSGQPRDGLPEIVPEAKLPITGQPINPVSRAKPDDFIQTGISSIDGFNTLVRGQKLPIFSGAGLSAGQIAAQIVSQATVASGNGDGEADDFIVVFAAIGITHRESSFFLRTFEETGAVGRSVCFLNLADDPTIERILTPRCALTAAEYLAFECDYHVLVVLTDMTNYCNALREISNAREEVPGRRGYPGYMYTDLASIYERAGRLYGKKGSITQLPILTMPDDDITHPIADLTGYITEGQVVLSRDLHQKGIYPPIDIMPSLSRLMNNGIGEGKTREDHREVANQLYACYAKARDLRRLVTIVGEDALGDDDRRYLTFADRFDKEMTGQGATNRSIIETLQLGWDLLSLFRPAELKRLSTEAIEQYLPKEARPS